MCTVTFIPQKEGFIFTSNRDEIPTRNAEQIITDENYIYPKDEGRGGTWFLIYKGNYVRCLLNGAFEKHKHQPPYAKSRGLMMLDSRNFETIRDLANHYSFEGIEPFTLVEISFRDETIVPMEVRWDGQRIFFEEFSAVERRIWSSSTLYPKDVRELREEWFAENLPEGNLTMDDLYTFHTSEPTSDSTINVLMIRENGPRTISISQFQSNGDVFRHRNLLNNTQYNTHNQTIETYEN
jgi:hypothetical protein